MSRWDKPLYSKEERERMFPAPTVANRLIAKTYFSLRKNPFDDLLRKHGWKPMGGDLSDAEARRETAKRTGVSVEHVKSVAMMAQFSADWR